MFFLLASTDLFRHRKQEKLELRRRGWKRVLETLILSLRRTVVEIQGEFLEPDSLGFNSVCLCLTSCVTLGKLPHLSGP